MAGRKYEKHIVTKFAPGLALPEFRGKPGEPTERSHFMMWLGDGVVKGSPYVEAVWLWPAAADPKGGFPQHVHGHDEIIGFFGTDTSKVLELGGEIEFWLEDERYLLTRSCLIYVPGGMKHCPIVFRRIERPIFHFLMTLGEYDSV
ncbi:MAG TPA: hypothetical protein VJ377_08600 [Dehalococcoidales bacterium]|nr:hypothetical protein [Dehalococcoidales bacterium]